MTTRLGLDALVAMNATPGIGDKLGPLNGQPTRLAFMHSIDRLCQRDILNRMVGPMDHEVAYQDEREVSPDYFSNINKYTDKERERLAKFASRGNPGASIKYLQSNTLATIDIRAENHGSIVLLFGMSEEGQSWLDRHVDKDALRMGSGIVAEPRYVNAILDGAISDGLTVA